jgi:hypothetical protein
MSRRKHVPRAQRRKSPSTQMAKQSKKKGGSGPPSDSRRRAMPQKAANASAARISAAAPAPLAAIVVFGRNDRGFPQAAWFRAEEADAAALAANLMGFTVLRLTKPETQRACQTALRPGELRGGDKTFAPISRLEHLEELEKLAKAAADPREQAKAGAEPLAAAAEHVPAAWQDIRRGSHVLAIDDDPDDGWWEAVVMDVQGELVELRWREWPQMSAITRSRAGLGLLLRS